MPKRVKKEEQELPQEAALPDLLPAIEMVHELMPVQPEDSQVLFKKWIGLLEELNREMRHFERITHLSGALKSVQEEESESEE